VGVVKIAEKKVVLFFLAVVLEGLIKRVVLVLVLL
jgi:hypothetical protein